MSDNEALIRLEQKIDTIMFALQSAGIMLAELPQLKGLESDVCALCASPVSLVIDTQNGTLIRNCGCKLPKKAFKLDLTTEEHKNANTRDQTNEISPNISQPDSGGS